MIQMEEVRRRRGTGVGMAMAVNGSAQAGQNFAPWESGAPQAEQWTFIELQSGEVLYHFRWQIVDLLPESATTCLNVDVQLPSCPDWSARESS
jgi:hypothetical protein